MNPIKGKVIEFAKAREQIVRRMKQNRAVKRGAEEFYPLMDGDHVIFGALLKGVLKELVLDTRDLDHPKVRIQIDKDARPDKRGYIIADFDDIIAKERKSKSKPTRRKR